MDTISIKKITPYQDINEVLYELAQGLENIFSDNLIGFYLFGSLSYGDFNLKRSDVDSLVVLKEPVPKDQLESIKKLHLEIEKNNPSWAKRVECSYTPLDMFQHILPPKNPRPYFGGGVFYPKAKYGNEWLINNYLLYKYGIVLLGSDFKTLIKPIHIKDVQKACVKDLFEEWEPKINDKKWLSNSHYQSYLVLNLCRILYTVICAEVTSKNVSTAWVKEKYPEWKNLIETAENWHYGIEMKRTSETIKFIKFVINEVH